MACEKLGGSFLPSEQWLSAAAWQLQTKSAAGKVAPHTVAAVLPVLHRLGFTGFDLPSLTGFATFLAWQGVLLPLSHRAESSNAREQEDLHTAAGSDQNSDRQGDSGSRDGSSSRSVGQSMASTGPQSPPQQGLLFTPSVNGVVNGSMAQHPGGAHRPVIRGHRIQGIQPSLDPLATSDAVRETLLAWGFPQRQLEAIVDAQAAARVLATAAAAAKAAEEAEQSQAASNRLSSSAPPDQQQQPQTSSVPRSLLPAAGQQQRAGSASVVDPSVLLQPPSFVAASAVLLTSSMDDGDSRGAALKSLEYDLEGPGQLSPANLLATLGSPVAPTPSSLVQPPARPNARTGAGSSTHDQSQESIDLETSVLRIPGLKEMPPTDLRAAGLLAAPKRAKRTLIAPAPPPSITQWTMGDASGSRGNE